MIVSNYIYRWRQYQQTIAVTLNEKKNNQKTVIIIKEEFLFNR